MTELAAQDIDRLGGIFGGDGQQAGAAVACRGVGRAEHVGADV